jgi:hypothetical protein
LLIPESFHLLHGLLKEYPADMESLIAQGIWMGPWALNAFMDQHCAIFHVYVG